MSLGSSGRGAAACRLGVHSSFIQVDVLFQPSDGKSRGCSATPVALYRSRRQYTNDHPWETPYRLGVDGDGDSREIPLPGASTGIVSQRNVLVLLGAPVPHPHRSLTAGDWDSAQISGARPPTSFFPIPETAS